MADQRNPAALAVRVGPAAEPPPAPGRQQLGLEQFRDSLLYVSPALRPGHPEPLLIILHGAGGDGTGGLLLLQSLADTHRLILLAPSSRGSTWDGIRGGYGPDVAVIDRALEQVFRFLPVDAARIGIAGFSDGASYALGLGLANGDLFHRILAFSPGFIPPAPREGRPAIFISHGVHDHVLPIQATSRRIVPQLRRDGYEVTYREFDGAHTVPADVVQEAAGWLGWDRPE